MRLTEQLLMAGKHRLSSRVKGTAMRSRYMKVGVTLVGSQRH